MWSWKFLQVTQCVPPVICLAARTLDMMEHCQLVPARHKQKQSAPRDLRLRLPHHATPRQARRRRWSRSWSICGGSNSRMSRNGGGATARGANRQEVSMCGHVAHVCLQPGAINSLSLFTYQGRIQSGRSWSVRRKFAKEIKLKIPNLSAEK